LTSILLSKGIFVVWILPLIIACGLMMPFTAEAELSNVPLLGPGARWRPAYEGSSNQRVEFVPVVRYLGRPWFIRTTQNVFEGGVRMELAQGLYAGVQLAYEHGRPTDESDFLQNHNIPDISQGASIGAQIEWDLKIGHMPLTLLARVRQNTDFDLGAQIDFRLSAGLFQIGCLAGGLVIQETFANTQSVNAYYGITPAQSAVSALPVYDAGGGWLFSSIGLLWSVDLARHWVVVGSMEARFLKGDAEHSPLTERSTNYFILAGVAYRF
jgi:outer membrane protein